MSLKRWFQDFQYRYARSIYARILGTYIENDDEATELSSKAIFPVDDSLERRRAEARAKLPENSVKRLIQDQPDTFVKPLALPDEDFQ